MLALQAAVLAAFFVEANSFTLEPPPNAWSSIGSDRSLVCKASEPINSCMWMTAYGEFYVLADGLSAESGRLRHFGSNEFDCGIFINGVETKDDGIWTCNVGVVEGGDEVKSARGRTMFHVARRPASVTLAKPHDSGVTNITALDRPTEIKCSVKDAKPAPSFGWMIDGSTLENVSTSTEKTANDSTWVQTLSYVPDLSHDNRTLSCVVSLVGFPDGDGRTAETILRFVTGDAFADPVADGEASKEALVGVLATLGTVFVVVFSVLSCWIFCKKRGGDGGPEEESGSEDNEKAGDGEFVTATPEEAPVRVSFGERFASLFRRRLSKKSTEKDAEAADDEGGEAKARGDSLEGGDGGRPVGRLFLRLFRRPTAAKDEGNVEERMAAEEIVDDDETKEGTKSEEAKDQLLELEPEDKPENDRDVEERKPSTN